MFHQLLTLLFTFQEAEPDESEDDEGGSSASNVSNFSK